MLDRWMSQSPWWRPVSTIAMIVLALVSARAFDGAFATGQIGQALLFGALQYFYFAPNARRAAQARLATTREAAPD